LWVEVKSGVEERHEPIGTKVDLRGSMSDFLALAYTKLRTALPPTTHLSIGVLIAAIYDRDHGSCISIQHARHPPRHDDGGVADAAAT
jgi:hypothetical protein